MKYSKSINDRNELHMLIETASDEEYVSIAAILCVVSGSGIDDIPFQYSRGTLKRAVARLRMAQRGAPEYGEKYEEAISYIRREWLHREVATA